MEEILRMDRRQFASRSAASLAALFVGALGVDSLVERAGAAVDAGPPSTPKGRFTVAQDAPPSTFDPAKAALGTEFRVARNTCEPLVYYDKNYKIQPLLASSWQSSSDNRKWSFTVRKGVTFHDGQPWNSTAMRKNFEYYAVN